MKKFIFTLLLVLSCSICLAFQNEPDGFRGVKFGDSSIVLMQKLMRVKKTPYGYKEIDNVCYEMEGEKVGSVFGHEASCVTFEFYKDRLMSYTVYFKNPLINSKYKGVLTPSAVLFVSEANGNMLKYFKNYFGEPTEDADVYRDSKGESTSYYWRSGNVWVWLEFPFWIERGNYVPHVRVTSALEFEEFGKRLGEYTGRFNSPK